MKNDELLPSERIQELIGPTRSDQEWQERAIKCIIDYLDEQHRKGDAGDGR